MKLELSEKQHQSIINSNARLNFWNGSVRSGKTVGSIYRFLYECANGVDGNFAVIGKTERTLIRNVFEPIRDILGDKEFTFNRGTGECRIGKRKCFVIGANDERSESKIRGVTLSGVYCDEITLFPESFFRMLLSRLSVKNAKLFGTTNPDSPYHWFKTDFVDKQELDTAIFEFRIDDNPFLDPVYVGNLKKEYTGLWYRRFILGEWCLAEGAVYDMFDVSRHVRQIKTPEQFIHKIIGVDYGTNNPCVFLMLGWNTPDKISVIKEYYYDSAKTLRQKTDSEYADDLIKFVDGLPILRIYIDPSALSFAQELRRRGVPVAQQVNNDVLAGIRTVSGFLTKNNITIDVSCQNLIESFTAYIWDKKSQIQGIDKPLKTNDHAADALRYAVMTCFGERAAGKTEYQSGSKRMDLKSNW